MKLPENLSARTSYLLGRAASRVQTLGERDANDARAYAVALTPSGDRLRLDAFELLLACEARFLTPLNRNERKQLHDLLARLTDL